MYLCATGEIRMVCRVCFARAMLAFHTAELPGNPVELDFKSGKIVQSNFFAQNGSIFRSDFFKLNHLKPLKK